MSALVAYQSSDEEDGSVEDNNNAGVSSVSAPEASVFTNTQSRSNETVQAETTLETATTSKWTTRDATHDGAGPPIAHAVLPGPSPMPANTTDDEPPPSDPRLSPYSSNRERVQSLTMPRFANLDIPPSPPPPEPTSDASADLLARTRKFERFLELKKQGVHFNQRLENSTSLRNPALLQKLMAFASIDAEEQYDNTLGKDFGVPTRWPDGFLENLVRDNEKRSKQEKEGRTRLEFVAAQKKNG